MNPSAYDPPFHPGEFNRITRARSFVRFLMFFSSVLLPPRLGNLTVARPERRSRAVPHASPGWHRWARERAILATRS